MGAFFKWKSQKYKMKIKNAYTYTKKIILWLEDLKLCEHIFINKSTVFLLVTHWCTTSQLHIYGEKVTSR